MSDRLVRLFFLLVVIGTATSFLSLTPFPTRVTKAYFIPYSRICFEHLWLDISANSTEYQIVDGPGFNSTLDESSTLGISLRAQTGSIDFYVEGMNNSIRYTRVRIEYMGWEDIKITCPTSDWLTLEDFQDRFDLNVTHTVPQGFWQYRLRFKNEDAQASRAVELSVVENWTEIDLREVYTSSNLLPFEFTYLGVAFLVLAVGLMTSGTATGKVKASDFRRFLREIYSNVCYHIENRERVHVVIILAIMIIVLLLLSTFAHTRLGVGEISVDNKMMKTFYIYHGFPFEQVGFVYPVTYEQYETFQTTFMWKINVGHGQGMFSGWTLVFYENPVSGRMSILWDGLLLNVLIYFALSFFLLTALDRARERFTGVSIKYLMKRGNQIKRIE